MIVLTIVFFVFVLLVTFDFVTSRYKEVAYWGACVFLILLAGLRPAEIDRDYISYVRMFKNDLFVDNILIEPSFKLIAYTLKMFSINAPVFLFLVYAILGVITKFVAIRQLSAYWFLSVLVFYCYIFILQDMTQIRAAVSVGFLLLSIKPLYDRRALPFFLFSLMAFLFHYSAVVAFFLWFLKPNKINVWVYAALLPIAYIIYFFTGFLATNWLNLIPAGAVASKAARYELATGLGLNVINSWQLIRVALCLFFLFNIDKLVAANKYAILFVKIYFLATVSFVALSSNPAVATRISDLFAVIDIVLLPCIAAVIRPRFAAIIIVVLIAFSYLALNLYFNKIII